MCYVKQNRPKVWTTFLDNAKKVPTSSSQNMLNPRDVGAIPESTLQLHFLQAKSISQTLFLLDKKKKAPTSQSVTQQLVWEKEIQPSRNRCWTTEKSFDISGLQIFGSKDLGFFFGPVF
jgi:hypothetical protein